jgi:hypothetical protein
MRLKRVEDVITGDWTAAGHQVGKRAKQEAKQVAATVTGGSGRLSHMGRGVALNSGYDLEAKGKRLIFKLRPPGPWVIMEKGAKAHAIKPKGGRLRGGGSGWGITPAIIAPGYDHPVYRTSHPGMRQKRGAIRKTFARVREMATPAYHDEMVKQIGRIYG